VVLRALAVLLGPVPGGGLSVPVSIVRAPELLVVGVDPAAKTGLAAVQGARGLGSAVVHRPDLSGLRRAQSIAADAVAFCSAFQGARPRVYVEGLSYRSRWAIVAAAQLRVLICDRLDAAGLQWWDVPPATLKWWTTGYGQADKATMREAVLARWGFAHESADVVDAYAAARLGQAHAAGEGGLEGVAPGAAAAFGRA